MTYPPPIAANGDYSSHSSQDVTYLPPAAAGGAVPGPDAAGESLGGRRAARRSLFGRLRRRPPHDGPEAVPGQPAAGVCAAASPDPEYTDGPGDRVAGYRPLHRADRAEHPGISWSAARPGPAQVASEEVNERLGPGRTAQEHLSACWPGAGRASTAVPRDPANDLAGDVPAAAWVAGRSGDPGRSLAGATFPDAVPAPAGPAAASDPLYRVLAGLAMRDLALVESLLQVAEQLESQEENPGQLELLFRIDHLATRMRRNSENLLVLVGQGGQNRGTEPVPLLDVVRAAISEITEYSRAQTSALPDVKLTGPSADDVSHILAELLDNATSKSPESAAVIVRAERTGDGMMILTVEDAGTGIPADQLAGINARLGRPPVLEPAATRHMGLYVVGRLAQRHSIRVQLRERPYGGTAAHVILPGGLIHTQPEAPGSSRRANQMRRAPRLKTGGFAVPPPAPAPDGPSAAPAVSRPPLTPTFAPADPDSLPRRSPGHAAAGEPDEARTSQIRADLSGFQLGRAGGAGGA